MQKSVAHCKCLTSSCRRARVSTQHVRICVPAAVCSNIWLRAESSGLYTSSCSTIQISTFYVHVKSVFPNVCRKLYHILRYSYYGHAGVLRLDVGVLASQCTYTTSVASSVQTLFCPFGSCVGFSAAPAPDMYLAMQSAFQRKIGRKLPVGYTRPREYGRMADNLPILYI